MPIAPQPTSARPAVCTPCQQAAMARMSIPQRLAFMKSVGLTAELEALEKQLATTGYKLPTPSAI